MYRLPFSYNLLCFVLQRYPVEVVFVTQTITTLGSKEAAFLAAFAAQKKMIFTSAQAGEFLGEPVLDGVTLLAIDRAVARYDLRPIYSA